MFLLSVFGAALHPRWSTATGVNTPSALPSPLGFFSRFLDMAAADTEKAGPAEQREVESIPSSSTVSAGLSNYTVQEGGGAP